MAMDTIKILTNDAQASLRSTVTVPTASIAVEELILNALDARATTIIVTLHFGRFSVMIEDNGCGIPFDDFPLLGERNATSKHHNDADSLSLSTNGYYGRHGHTLHSLGQLSNLTITSRTLVGSNTPRPRYDTYRKRIQYGTALSTEPITDSTLHSSPYPVLLRSLTTTGTFLLIENLFGNQPVRQRSFNPRKETERIIDTVTSISIMHPTVTFIVREEMEDNIFGTIENTTPLNNDNHHHHSPDNSIHRSLPLHSSSAMVVPNHLSTKYSQQLSSFSSSTLRLPVSFRELLRIPRASSLIHRFSCIYGQSTSLSLVSVAAVSPCQNYSIDGYLGIDKSKRQIQFIYLNGRYGRQVSNIMKFIDALLPPVPNDTGTTITAVSTVYILNIQCRLPSCIDTVQEPDRTLVQFREPDIVWKFIETTIKNSIDNLPWMVTKGLRTNENDSTNHRNKPSERPQSSSVLNPNTGLRLNSALLNNANGKFQLSVGKNDGHHSVGSMMTDNFSVPIPSVTTHHPIEFTDHFTTTNESTSVTSTYGYGITTSCNDCHGTHAIPVSSTSGQGSAPSVPLFIGTPSPYTGVPFLAMTSSPFTSSDYNVTGTANTFDDTHSLDDIFFPPSPTKVSRVNVNDRSPIHRSLPSVSSLPTIKTSPYFSTALFEPSETSLNTTIRKLPPSLSCTSSPESSSFLRGITETTNQTFQGDSTFIPRIGLATGRPGKAVSQLQYGLNTHTEDILYHADLQAKVAGNIQGIPLFPFPATSTDPKQSSSSFLTSRGGVPITITMLNDLAYGTNHSQIIGQLDKKFIVGYVNFSLPSSVSGTPEKFFHTYTPSASGQLIIIDQHAADERIRLEQLEQTLFRSAITQRLLSENRYLDISMDGMVITEKSAVPSFEPPDGSRYFSRLTVHPPEMFAVTPRERHLIHTFLPLLNIWGFQFDWSSTNDTVSLGTDASLSPFTTHPAVTVPSHVYLRSVPQLFDIPLSGKDLREFIGRLENVDTVQDTLSSNEVRMTGPASANGSSDTFRSAHLHTLRQQWYGKNMYPYAITRILHSKACRGAVMFGDTLSLTECETLLHKLVRTRLPFQCAHGRPSMVPLVTLVYTETHDK